MTRWDAWVADLNSVGSITLPRCLYEDNAGKILSTELHGFADASQKAYCDMIYLVCRTTKGTYSRLICAKTRVAPLKKLSIPRLKLMSAKILASLTDVVVKALSPQVNIDSIHYWLDSKCALYWINNQNNWKQFVKHHVNEILEIAQKFGNTAQVQITLLIWDPEVLRQLN